LSRKTKSSSSGPVGEALLGGMMAFCLMVTELCSTKIDRRRVVDSEHRGAQAGDSKPSRHEDWLHATPPSRLHRSLEAHAQGYQSSQRRLTPRPQRSCVQSLQCGAGLSSQDPPAQGSRDEAFHVTLCVTRFVSLQLFLLEWAFCKHETHHMHSRIYGLSTSASP
jgi:hypothetical protein